MSDALDALLRRADALLSRLEAVLPQPLTPPDWEAAVAFRYRKRGASLQPITRLTPEVEVDAASKGAPLMP